VRFGVIQAESFDLDCDMAWLGLRIRHLLDDEGVWPAKVVDDDCFHVWQCLLSDWKAEKLLDVFF
jgi:hypothetical protein